jgi:hypothetical protein
MLAEHRWLRVGFEARIEEVWGGALDRYYMTYIACLEAGEDHRNSVGVAAAAAIELKLSNSLRQKCLFHRARNFVMVLTRRAC